MREWLLKDEKNKVGRPKLANDEILKKANMSIFFSLLAVFILVFSYIGYLKGVNPLSFAYSLTIEKIVGSVNNANGFMVSEYYDDNHDYIIEVKVSDAIKKYKSDYRYTTYYLKNDDWVKYESKVIPYNKNQFKILFNSVKNINKTWMIKFELVTEKEINESFAPSNWKMQKGKKDSYAYKILTVKGYYSPVLKEEIKEIKEKESKIYFETKKNDPRNFIFNIEDKYTYKMKVVYTDQYNKNIILTQKENLSGNTNYKIPLMVSSTNVRFNIWIDNITKEELEDIKLDNWEIKEDKDKHIYISASYLLKPENTYKN